MTAHFVLDMAARTDRGLVRESNQDVAVVVPRLALALVADGMGGQAGGEVASGAAGRGFSSMFETLGGVGHVLDETKERVVEAFRAANREVASSRTSTETNMGTTLVAAVFAHDRLLLANVGDSRCYRLRKGVLEQLSQDHSYAAELRRSAVERGAPDDPAAAQWEHVLTRCVDGDESLVIDVRVTATQLGEVYLLCSDGLWGAIPDALIGKTLGGAQDAADACTRLVLAACAAGGADNIGVAVVRLVAESLSVGDPFEPLPLSEQSQAPGPSSEADDG